MTDTKRCGARHPKKNETCARDAAHVGMHSNGGNVTWKSPKPPPAEAIDKVFAPPARAECGDTMAGHVCILDKGHKGDHKADRGEWSRDRKSARFDCAPDHDEREDDDGDDPHEDEIRSDEEREFSRKMRQDREAHAAELSHEAPTALIKVEQQPSMVLSVEAARELLAKSKSVDEVRDIADKAAAVAAYLRVKNASTESQNDAAEIRLRAERRLGELLSETPKAKGPRLKGRTVGGPLVQPPKDEPPTLADQGIKKGDAAKWQKLAKIPEKKFETLVEETKAKGQRLTTSAPLKMLRQEEKAKKAAELRAKPIPQAAGRFDVIVIDPPWMHDKRAEDVTQRGQGDYPRMTLEEIKALPVADRAEENCILWCWVTNQHMRQAFECLDAWGFVEKSILTWGKDHFGNGDWLRGQTEHCILAVKGSPIVTLTNQSTLLEGEKREHSRKPETFYELVESLCPGTKLEMFAQTPREGWAAWGSDAQKYEAA
jgi:N6-adenosine-specific RNA methylase IME4